MKSMRVLVIGAGGVGLYFSGRLSQAGAEVAVVARSDYETAVHGGYDIQSIAGDFHFSPEVLRSAAEYRGEADYVLVEADGSRGLPLKAHAPHEPVIPPNSNPVICVVGAAGFYHPADQVCHRPEIFARLAGMKRSDPVTPCHAAQVIRAEGLAGRVFLNQVESSQDQAAARAFAAALGQPVIAGSLHKGVFSCL